MKIIIDIADDTLSEILANLQAFNGWSGLDNEQIVAKIQEKLRDELRTQAFLGKDIKAKLEAKVIIQETYNAKIT